MKVVYLGSAGPLSCIPFRALLETGRDIAAVGAAGASQTLVGARMIPVIAENHETIESLARVHGVPVTGLSGDWSREIPLLERYVPDVILVSCFPWRLPDEVLSIPGLGCFNLHPSLLPAYRGPSPLYWQFRGKVSKFGITLHRMSPQLDAGNIVGQTVVPMPDGVSLQQANRLLADAGGELMKQVLVDIKDGSLTERKQDESQASYQGFPPSDND